MGDVVEFTASDRKIEHVDKTTIVERIPWTDEMKAKFAELGYNLEDKDNEDEK